MQQVDNGPASPSRVSAAKGDEVCPGPISYGTEQLPSTALVPATEPLWPNCPTP